MDTYEYAVANFEGPLDLLLHLIERHKIDIYDIPIVSITSQYMAYLHSWDQFDIQYSSEFLVMAATLLQIKSRLLLPKAAVEMEEEDPRDELVQQLVEYKQIKALESLLEEKSLVMSRLYARPEEVSQLGREKIFRFELSHLYQIFKRCYAEAKDKEKEAPVVQMEKDQVPLEGMLENLEEQFSKGLRISFYSLLRRGHTKEHVVVTFMAVLELLKRQVVRLSSKASVGEEASYEMSGNIDEDVWIEGAKKNDGGK